MSYGHIVWDRIVIMVILHNFTSEIPFVVTVWSNEGEGDAAWHLPVVFAHPQALYNQTYKLLVNSISSCSPVCIFSVDAVAI